MPGDRVVLSRADITTLAHDAIVNAANEALAPGGGVCGAIFSAAGHDELEAACRAIPEVAPGVRCPTGEARVTPGFGLPAKHVIHAVGPVWEGGDAGEEPLLRSCYVNALRLAMEHDVRTIAFPAISCGIFGYPIEEACVTALRAIRSVLAANPTAFDRVELSCFDPNVHDAYQRLLAE